MAYVAVTDKTISDIRSFVQKMREAELSSLDNVVAEFNRILEIPELREEIETSAWGKFADLRYRLKDRLCWKGDLELCVIHADTDKELYKRPSTLVTVKVDKFPFGILQNDSYYKRTSYKYVFNNDHYHAHIKHLVQLLSEHSEVMNRWGKVEKQLIEFIRNTKSINEAVKLWPDIKTYLPNNIIEKLEEKQERKTASSSSAATILEKMDIETLKHSAVIGKMLKKD